MANGLISELLGGAVELGGAFGDIAAVDPVSAVLLALGALVMLFVGALTGVMVLGAVGDLLIPDSLGRAPPRRE